MSTYTITNTEPAEEGYVYVDVIIDDATETIRLILPNDENAAKQKMTEYLNPEQIPAVVTQVDSLIDQTIEV